MKVTNFNLFISWLVALIPWLAISWFIGKLLDTSIWYILIGIQIINLIFLSIKAGAEFLLFHLIWKKSGIEIITKSLVAQNYPNPQKYPNILPVKEFFYKVMMDDELNIATRLDAAQVIPLIDNPVLGRGIINKMRTEKVFREAIEEFQKNKFSQRGYYEFKD